MFRLRKWTPHSQNCSEFERYASFRLWHFYGIKLILNILLLLLMIIISDKHGYIGVVGALLAGMMLMLGGTEMIAIFERDEAFEYKKITQYNDV